MKNEIKVNENFKFTTIKNGGGIGLIFTNLHDDRITFNTTLRVDEFIKFSEQIQELVKIFKSIDRIDWLCLDKSI